MTALPDHIDVAAYVLGVLDEDEVDAFENHLAQCRKCALDLKDFAVLPDLLDEADQAGLLRGTAGERPDGRSVRAMLDSVSIDRGRKKRNYALAAAAVAVLLMGGTAAATVKLTSGSGNTSNVAQNVQDPPRQSAVANNETDVFQELSRSDPKTGLSAKIHARPEAWGTSIEFEVEGAKGPGRCELVALARDGGTMPVTSWLVSAPPANGDKAPVQLDGGLGMKWNDIAAFVVRDSSGATLLNMPT
ncbi:zf-HC2 domain-containing protein [Umezawaea sp. Da 62-37]|uniref:anti-sigma factor family protein n=1 Tax=Umezawaea sp. Da 62-37 TaxID=3075927 RepID=UPI0028F6E6F2|nr:zf-HC2 domain-containing protein [Umezawaea sp. Da 62-37]WNV84413.1 zf-HC2 domain-containing protein [Umezawaea sp. Da 62-37]